MAIVKRKARAHAKAIELIKKAGVPYALIPFRILAGNEKGKVYVWDAALQGLSLGTVLDQLAICGMDVNTSFEEGVSFVGIDRQFVTVTCDTAKYKVTLIEPYSSLMSSRDKLLLASSLQLAVSSRK